MAQVRKFQGGGKTFKINGKTYNTSNSEDMKRLEEMTSNSEYGGIAQQILANVNDAAYDNTLNVYRTSDGRVMMEGGLQNVADQYMSQGTQKATQRKDNAWNNAFKRRSGKDWINNLDSFLNAFDSKSSTTSSSSNADGKIKISGVSGLGGQWKYNDQGWDEADINNAAMLKELQLLEDYYKASEEDRKNKYDVSGLDKRSLEAYINMRQNDPTLYSKYLESFKADRPVLDNDDFYSTYGWFGFTQDPDAKKATNNKALKEYLATQGLDFDGAENIFYRDKNGNLMVTDAFLTNVLGGDRNGHYWLNDNWADLKTDNGNTNPYSQMRNHIIWNGRIYKQDDAAVLAELQKSGYIDANKAYDAAKAEQIMRTQWSDNPTFAHEAYDPELAYSEWAHGYKDKGLRYRTIESNLGEGRHLVGYYTNDDDANNYGFRTERFAIIGDDGKLIQDNVDPSTIAKKENGKYVSGTTRFMQKRLGQDAGALAGTYIDGTSIDGKPSNTFFYKNPTTEEFFIQDPDLKGKQKGKAVRIPKEVATMIPKEAWEYFRTNKDAKDRLFRKMKDWTNTGFGKRALRGLKNRVTFGIDDLIQNTLLKQDFQKAGLSKEQAEQVVKLLIEWGTNKKYKEATGKYDASATARQQAFLADPQTEEVVRPVFKEGGKIVKHQYGNVLGQQGKTELKTINLQESDKKDANTGQSWGLGSKDSKQWSSLDTMELAGAAADLASLGITIADPTNILGAIASTAGSFTNFGVDVKRDGFQGKDLGRLALNLVLDAGTLIPILGDGIQGAKAIRAMKKAVPILDKAIKAGAIVGIGDAAINTIDKIAKGESFTLSDVRRIINGVQGGVTLGRSGLLNQTKGKKTTKFENIEIKGNGIKGLTLTETEIKSLKGIKDPEKLKDAIVNMWKSQNKKSKLSKAKILEKLDLSELLSTSKRPQWRFWKGFNEVEKINLPSAKGYRPELTTEQLDNISKKRNGFQNWFWGTGKHRNWLGQVEGDEFLSHYIRTPEGKAHRARKAAPSNPNPRYYELVQHANPRAVYRLNPWATPNIVSTQQFPQEMEFTENVSAVPMKRLVFKKGGVLKADTGLKFDFKPKTYTGKLNSFNNFKIKSDLLDPNYKPITGVGERVVSQVMTRTTPSIGTMYDAFGKEIDTKLTPNNSPVKTVSPSSTQDNSQTISQMGGRPSDDNSFNTALFSRDALGVANYLRANKESEDLYTIDKNIADITGRRTVKAPNILTNRRFMTNTNNQYNDLIGKYNTSIGQQITNDAFANMTARLIGADKTADIMRDMNRELSTEFNNAQDRWQQNWQQQQLYNTDSANKNNEVQVASAIAGEQARASKLTRDSQRRNLAYNSLQDRLHNLGTIDANAKMQSYMYKDLAAKAITPEQKSAYENLSAQVLSNDFLNAKKQQAGLWWAKRGGKFRPTKDQLLLDNQKIVAKAIEKINDNTMKLILKAMS